MQFSTLEFLGEEEQEEDPLSFLSNWQYRQSALVPCADELLAWRESQEWAFYQVKRGERHTFK